MITMTHQTICIPNIGARGIRRRRLRGVVWFAIGAAVAVALLVRHAPLLWYSALLVSFTAAAVYWFQAREKT